MKQPWAWAIAAGHKLVENRSRGTSWRGPLLIHAGAAWSGRGATDPRVCEAWPGMQCTTRHPDGVRWVHDAVDPRSPAIVSGAVLAIAQLVDSHPDAGCCRPWGESAYAEGSGRTVRDVHHLVLEDVIPLAAPVSARGQLGLWQPSAELAAAAWATDVDMTSLQPGGDR